MSSVHHTETRSLRRLWELLRADRHDLWVIVFFALLVSLLSLVIPIGIEALVSTVMFGVAIWPLIWLAAIMLFCLGLAAFIIALEIWLVELLQRRLFVRVIADFANRLPRVRLDVMRQENGPSLLNRFFEVMTIQKAFATLILDGTRLLITTLVGLVVLGFYHPLLLAFALGLILAMVVLVLLGIGGLRTQIEESHAKYEMAELLEDVARHPPLFKLGSAPEFVRLTADRIAREYIDRRSRHFHIVFRQVIFGLFVYVASSTILLGLGGYLVIQQQLTLGQLVAAELILALVVGSLTKLGKYLDSWYDIRTGIEKLGHITDLPIERDDGLELPKSTLGFRLRLIAAPNHPPIEIAPGERIAITSRGGAQQSAMIEMLAGLRDSERGQVVIDGYDLLDLKLSTVREQSAFVQQIEIFSGSVQDNLDVGRSLNPSAMHEALNALNLLDTISSLPEGMASTLHPNGQPLSLLDALRLCVARALAGRPRMLVLDRVLDAIDRSECPELMRVLFDRSLTTTIVIVTLDDDLISRCDRRLTL